MARPQKLNRERLQAAALALVDEHGLAGLTMRSLAAALGTAPMTLYNHVASRADLEALVVDAVLAQADWRAAGSEDQTGDWHDDVRAIATALWRAARAHPHAIPLIPTRRSRAQALLEPSEALLDALARSGRSGGALLVAFRAVIGFVLGFAQAELGGPLADAAGEEPSAVIARFRALPRFRYPRLVEIADAATTSDAEDEFREALELLLDGIAAGSVDAAGRRAPVLEPSGSSLPPAKGKRQPSRR
jgi:AcrR family transcriptional regulator